MTVTRKYWISEDGQDTLGCWDIETEDQEIWNDLEAQGHDGSGRIITGPWTI